MTARFIGSSLHDLSNVKEGEGVLQLCRGRAKTRVKAAKERERERQRNWLEYLYIKQVWWSEAAFIRLSPTLRVVKSTTGIVASHIYGIYQPVHACHQGEEKKSLEGKGLSRAPLKPLARYSYTYS